MVAFSTNVTEKLRHGKENVGMGENMKQTAVFVWLYFMYLSQLFYKLWMVIWS